jgi:hypothetical protein
MTPYDALLALVNALIQHDFCLPRTNGEEHPALLQALHTLDDNDPNAPSSPLRDDRKQSEIRLG